MRYIKVGEELPDATLYEGSPDDPRNILDLVENNKAIIFGVSGAFVPGCTKVHLTGFLQKSSELRNLGFGEIICVSVNDPYVMMAWGESRGVDGQIRMLADPQAIFTTLIGMNTDMPELGGTRSRRYSMATLNGVVRELFIDAPNAKLTCMDKEGSEYSYLR